MPDLDRLAQACRVGGLAHQAAIDALATLGHPAQDLGRPVNRRALFIARDQQTDRASEVGRAAKKTGRSGGEACDRPFHVGSAATIEVVLAHFGGKGIDGPCRLVPNRYDIDVPGKAEVGRGRAVTRVEIADVGRAVLRKREAVTDEPEPF